MSLMNKPAQILLFLSATFLAAGFGLHLLWAFGGVIGLVPAIKWFIDDLRDKQMGSDVLAILSIVGAIAIGEFFAAAVISLMLHSGRALESWAEGQAESALKSLMDRMPKLAHRIRNGVIETIDASKVVAGDQLLVKSGEMVPVDGTTMSTCYLDQSALTGEPLPVLLKENDTVLSGTINAGNNFEMKATGTLVQSTYSGIVTLVRNSRAASSPNIRLANTWAMRFVPFSVLLALAAYLVSGEASRAVAVLVVATPCPLILAIPIALVAGMSRATKIGAVIKGGGALERLSRAEIVLLDKTGTVTHGGPVLSDIQTLPGITPEYALQIAASLEQYSPHVVAKALVEDAISRGIELLGASDVHEDHGREVSGIVAGQKVTVGAPPSSMPMWAKISFPLIVALHVDSQLVAVFGLADPIREESGKTIKQLRELGVKEIVLVTGDREETAREVAEVLGVTRVIAEAKPETKLNVVHDYRNKSSGTVVVVGDGINDAPALAASDVGIAMGARGASAASEAADVVIIEDSVDRVAKAISIAKISRRKAFQSSVGGMTIAAGAMVAAAFNYLTPSEGAVLQEFIDVLAILWALTALRARA